jgi:hypothetical protein
VIDLALFLSAFPSILDFFGLSSQDVFHPARLNSLEN